MEGKYNITNYKLVDHSPNNVYTNLQREYAYISNMSINLQNLQAMSYYHLQELQVNQIFDCIYVLDCTRDACIILGCRGADTGVV